jgi:[protein-PII] uridylyltransferase
MPTGPSFRSAILKAREQLAQGRSRLREQHGSGSPGVQVSARLTALVDAILMDLFQSALADLGQDHADGMRQRVALVAHGGYGRRALAPYSDVDLMILHEAGSSDDVQGLARRLMQDIYDLGLELGHSVRRPLEACRLARDDATIYSSLVESRLLIGADSVYQAFRGRFARLAERRSAALLDRVIRARREEQAQFGKTVYLLEPHIKRSRGGLRDIQLLRWIGFTKFGSSDPDHLQLMGALSKQDLRAIRAATEFLMQVRNEMHFFAGKSQDVLDRAEQVRLAEVQGYRLQTGLLPVEQFMREYFRHTSNVRNLVSRFVESVRPRRALARVLGPIFSHQVEGDYRVGRSEIAATRRGDEKLNRDLVEVLRLMELASLYNKRISHATWASVYRAAPAYPNTVSPAVADRFLSLLAQPVRLGELLRRLHELRVLEKIIPAFTHARCLLQFNEYHKYTVDEHCIRSVECATEFLADAGPLGAAYREIKQKQLLHLALLLHDLGKGMPQDHSEAGMEIARETAQRLQLHEREAEAVAFLVHKHLMMSHLAFRRDTSDERVVLRFAVEVGSPEILRMLYVLTCADLAAVGPEVLNSWKIDVLTNLYDRAMRHLAGDRASDPDKRLQACRTRVVEQLAGHGSASATAQVHDLPAAWFFELPSERIVQWIERLERLEPGQEDAWGEFLPASETVEYLFASRQETPGLFYRLTGALTSKGLEIHSAQINTLPGGLVLDRFVVEDPDFSGPPPPERIDGVCQALRESVHRREPPRFRQIWGHDGAAARRLLTPLPTRVLVDNNTSDQHTIIDVFTFDRTGLLYAIAKTIYEMGLSISFARIGTYLDQVVDVFYVTDFEGRKVEEERRVTDIRRRLLEAVEERPAVATR